MPWDRTQPTNPKYRTATHRRYRASLVAQLRAQGHLICTATVCVMPDRTITNANGNARDGLHAGHNDTGTDYAGPQHNACNVRDGAIRANARSHGGPTRWVL